MVRRAATLVLVLIAAFAAPIRQACGSACIEPPAAEQHAAAASSCHKPELPPEPEPAPEHCTHDHTASLNASPRFAIAASADQPAQLPVIDTPMLYVALELAAVPRSGLSPGSPPIRLIALRI